MRLFQKHEDGWQALVKVVFAVSSITFMIMFVVEFFLPGFVTNWFNPIWFLIISAVSVIILAVKE